MSDRWTRAASRGVPRRLGEDGECLASTRVRLGGHAFGSERALYSLGGHDVAVEGDVRACALARRQVKEDGDPILLESDGFVELHPELAGNAAAVDRETGRLHLVSDWAGSFPLYYVPWRGGLLFANLLSNRS